ncbi:MAG: hypothetical protein NVS9B2_23860 [Steroidobacteraceae bacterium]
MAKANRPLSRSEQMSRIRDRDTVPEMLLRKALWKMGLRYRLRQRLPGRPDIAFSSAKLLVFADGCFWHGCPEHYRTPKTRTSYWSPKIDMNIARDRRNDALLRAAGWHVVRLWEHEIESDPEASARRVAELACRLRGARAGKPGSSSNSENSSRMQRYRRNKMPDSGGRNLEKPPVPRLAAGEVPLISLFCGAGGLDRGFDSAGFRTIFAADSMQAAVDSFNHNAGTRVATVLDLLNTSSADIASAVRKRVAHAGAAPRGLLGGPPCQGVSNANNQSGPTDPRNRLFARYSNIVLDLDKEFGLDFFVFENVPGLKVAKNRPLYDTLVEQLGTAYELHEAILDASKFGVPQTRRRLIIVGISKRLKGADFKFPVPDESAEAPTVENAIGGLPDPIFFARGTKGGSSATHANHWTMAPKSGKFSGSAVPKDGRSFIRLKWDAPSRTVAYGNREIHVHPSGTRRLSIYEALCLQGFPKSFELLGNLSEQVTQVSNAVPPPVAAAVARSVADALARARRPRGK